MRNEREDFFGHELIHKLTNQINKRTKSGFLYLIVKDTPTIDLLKNNISWLDYVGIYIDDDIKEGKPVLIIKWRGIQ